MTIATSRKVGAASALGIAALVATGGAMIATRGPGAKAAVTYSKDVAPIIQQNCQVCHRPNSIAPMTLMNYEDAKKVAKKIAARVEAREMPPWHIDKTIGIKEFKNDRSLTDAQIKTILQWVADGAPQGNPADEPPTPTWPDESQWQLSSKVGGPPDLVIKSAPYDVRGAGQDVWWRPTTPTGVTEPRWVRAIEIKPSQRGRKVVHHVLTLLEQRETGGLTGLASTAGQRTAGLFMEWAIGKAGEIYADGAGKLLLPDSKIRWEVHYYAAGDPVPSDTVELGVWFYPKGYTPKYRTILQMFSAIPAGTELDIPPNSTTTVTNTFTISAPARIENFQPHMHMRGKSMQMEALYPDGTRELLSKVSNFQWRWHVNYIYASDAAPLLPKGTKLIFTAVHDNTIMNGNNPDPRQWIGYGDRTVDEMAHTWVDVTYLEQEDFDRFVAERKAKGKPTGGERVPR